ncbi:hypothetical protein E2542_SST24086 [Spatholobus suberectus]|nr:hypothetical protein E2542_SST24086 [Spatholobus suberectus]
MEGKETPDFSSYFHFEASGDSEEAGCDPPNPIMGGCACEIPRPIGDVDDNDDALSCNYDGSGACNVAELDEEESCDEEHDDEKKEDEEKSGVYGMSHCEEDDDDMQEEHMKSYVSFESGQEFVDEMEKNRLFWEACLAS